MANKRISDLTSLTSLATNDEFVVVDVSDTSQSPTGTNKKILSSDLFNGDPVHLLKSGGTMSGVLNMGSNGITNLSDPTNAQDAATKNYVDTHGGGGGGGTWGTIVGTLSSQTDLQTALNAKEPTISASTTAKYWRGDKTFQTLNTDAVPEAANLYYTDTRVRLNRLDQMTVPNNALNLNAQLLSNVGNPISAQDAATKSYVDGVATGLSIKNSVVVATTTTLPAYTFSSDILTATSNGAFAAVDGVTLSLNDRLLVKNETGGNAKYNGLYSLTQVGDGSNPYKLTRTTDADTSGEMASGAYCFVTQGTVNAATGWVLTTANPITLDTTSLTFTQFSASVAFAAGTGITIASSTISLDTTYTDGRYYTKTLGDARYTLKAGDTMTGLLQFSGTGHAGLQLNSLTTTQRNALTPANGMLIYNSTLTQINKYENSQWVDISKSPATIIIAPSGSGYAADYYPDGTADDFEIQAAINAVHALGQGSIFIRAGTYIISKNIALYSNITIYGEGWNTILKLGNSVNDTVLQNLTTNPGTNIHIRDLAIDMNASNNTTINQKGGIKMENSTHCTIQRVKVSNFRHAQGQLNTAIGVQDMTHLLIKDCYIFNVGDYGIAVSGAVQSEIIGNYVQNPAGHGISTELGTVGSATERNIGNTISNNVIFYDANEVLTNQDGIKLGRCDGCVISNNTIYNTLENAKLGILYAEDSSLSTDNDFDRGNIISNNTIYGCNQGMWILGSLNDIISNNTITIPGSTGSYGIQVTVSTNTNTPTNSEEMQIVGNTIIQKTNSSIGAGGGITIYGNAHHINVTGNNIFNMANSGIQIVAGCTNINVTGNIIRDSMRYSIHIGAAFGAGGQSSTGASYNTVTGNNLSGASRASNGTYNEIQLWGSSIYNLISGNTINIPNSNKINYGIHEDGSVGTPDHNIVANNVCENPVSNFTVLLVGTSSMAYGNTHSRGYELLSTNSNGPNFQLNQQGTSKGRKVIRSRGGKLQFLDDGTSNALMTIVDTGQTGLYNITSPTAFIHLPAGAAAASNSPLKFTSGTNLTSPEAGAMEFDGSHLYFTIGSTRYQMDQQLSGSAVTSLTGTANQVLVNGTSGSATTGAVTLTLPQSIGTGSSPTFTSLTLSAQSSNLSLNSNKLTNLLDPTSSQDAATKNYVDSVAAGLTVKNSVRLATVAALAANTYSNGTSGVGATLTANSVGALTVDGVATALNDRILVQNEATASHNGIYQVTTLGTAGVAYVLTRTTDMDQSAEIDGSFCFVEEGSTNADAGFVCTTTGTVTMGSTAINFTQFSGAAQITAGAGMTKTGNTLDVIGTANRILVNADSIDISASYVGQSSITTLGTITTGIWTGTTIAIANGGTGQTTKAAAFDALSPMTTLGDVIYGGTSGANTRLAGNTTATKNFLRQTGTGSVSAAPAWDTVTSTDVGLGSVENTALSTWAGSANITTLGTITTGVWSGTAIDHTKLTGIVQADVGGLTTASSPTFADLTSTGNINVNSNSSINASGGASFNTTLQSVNFVVGTSSITNAIFVDGTNNEVDFHSMVACLTVDTANAAALQIRNSTNNAASDAALLFEVKTGTSTFQDFTMGIGRSDSNFKITNGTDLTATAYLSINHSNGNLNIASGAAYLINGTSVLSSTTLGSGVTASSLTSVGTLSSLTLGGTLNMGTQSINTVGNIEMDYSAARDITVGRQPSSGGGNNLTIQAGGAFSTGTNLGGGSVIVSAGVSTGNSSGGTIKFQTPLQGSSGSGDNTLTNRLTIAATSSARILIGNGLTSTTDTNNGLNFLGTLAETIYMQRHTTSNTAGNSLTIQSGGAAGGATATDKAAGDLILATGLSTGTAGGKIRLQVPNSAVSTGTSDNALVDRIIVTGQKILTNTSATPVVDIALATLAMTGGTIIWTVESTDGTDMQVVSGITIYSAENKGGVYVTAIKSAENNVADDTTAAKSVSAGLITATWTIVTGTNKVTLTLNVNAAKTGTGYPRVTYTLINNSQAAPTIL